MSETKVSWISNNEKDGRFKRSERTFRNKLGDEEYALEKGRYHLYVSWACPWAHRTLITRHLYGMDDITYDVVDFLLKRPAGWTLHANDPDATKDTINGFERLRQVYEQSKPDYDDTVTVPILYDKKTKTIVNNESSEIIRQFNSVRSSWATRNQDIDIYPEHLRSKIDAVNEWIYNDINNGVYKTGFATSQTAHEEAFDKLFVALDKAEKILSENRYLCGEDFTEADIRLWVTLIRFDVVYVVHFKCNLKRIEDYPNLSNYLRELYSWPCFRDTTNLFHIKHHYYESHDHINPFKIVPKGPLVDFNTPHDRERLKAGKKPQF
ncbi:hypothetical protein PROFUN_05476 [Planoprotostelium fungivorum]|uniref:GST C-terminal domain-containing protein n=1 Tax=Planoprotostelium fungivorum TaxID=1890364 RepID=A0A2P6NQV4_9EUKA|nr:hypothetical protein PROFUN_05476 [Planoprotostelium fungivorum]